MRAAIAVLFIALVGLATYHLVMSQANPELRTVDIEGKKLILRGFENPAVKVKGCGEEALLHGSIVEIPLNCSKVKVEVYSEGRLVFSSSLSLNP
ncbi:hypothetical protein [Archaeoglobus fulgidus]|jgi:hypothetical protein|uniref:Uncharacterized protein AF_1276 n=3 Tax=Archaeoglobus fulgidus TaxID=2234 RepID=Y1276_ARCFU|nr:hypothetical protein [Archaeoglobus fulgidus]O28992.1 RecName: Full=Uncharacterized protein AF_1276; Flags: Precursor [Archaeoglobus fulgidus DSM 4304]AAB89977.1 predicted coding region AF_1276 [Archaeoglobus fulgidus DSM 4304]AIG98155.1 hypothetical protein AFULGI_00013840 [Archaeoglobus fulgidus DSM 8774]KUJ92921.1 MAG: hypothetical protein XD40_1889 [Archaeoglobus fulgidus]KUK06400.1 MAG: Uncharacterized protein XD48_1375 [Archaeoglobus fulgidus]